MKIEKRDLYIVGAGGVGRHILENRKDYSLSYREIFFIDDNKELEGCIINHCKVIGDLHYLKQVSATADVVLGLSNPQQKLKILSELEGIKNFNYPSLISSCAWISPDVVIGIGTIIYPNSSINTGSTIGDFVHVNMNCAIGHDCEIGKATFLAPRVSLGGWTIIGKSSFMGIGSSTLPNVRLAETSIVGASCLVNRSYEYPVKLLGIPCQEILD